jgi:hypothetical protein
MIMISATTMKNILRILFYNLAPYKKQQQTFDIILPNLIHKSKKRNLT